MNSSLWIALIGLSTVGVFALFAFIGRQKENASLLRSGLCADAEIVASSTTPFGHRFRSTIVTYRFLPVGHSDPIEVTKVIDAVVELPIGAIVPVRYLSGHPNISVLVPYADRQNAS